MTNTTPDLVGRLRDESHAFYIPSLSEQVGIRLLLGDAADKIERQEIELTRLRNERNKALREAAKVVEGWKDGQPELVQCAGMRFHIAQSIRSLIKETPGE